MTNDVIMIPYCLLLAGFDETILMLLEFLESLPLTMTEQKVKRPPPLTHLRNGQRIAVKKDDSKGDKTAAPKAASTITDDDGWGSDGEEKGEVIDGEDLDADDSEDEEEEEELVGPGGKRLVMRREFMLTPKGEMIEKPGKKRKEPREQKDKEDKDNN